MSRVVKFGGDLVNLDFVPGINEKQRSAIYKILKPASSSKVNNGVNIMRDMIEKRRKEINKEIEEKRKRNNAQRMDRDRIRGDR